MTEDEIDEYKERSAIIEYDGQLLREEAERIAIEIIISKRKKAIKE